jgi:hypothetical protein
MQAYRTKAVVDENGALALEAVPFPSGSRVEVIVLPAEEQALAVAHPLRGTPYRYDSPTDPVGEADWESAA